MAAEKRPANDDDDGGPRPYVRVSNRQRLAQQKRPPGAGGTAPTTKRPTPTPSRGSAGAAAEEETKTQGDLSSFYRAWQWKREHLPDRLRFHQPYRYEWDEEEEEEEEEGGGGGENGGGGGDPPPAPLPIEQRPFGPEGFASTVWDSSIVVAKMIERRAGDFRGMRCCDLSAGCGLPAAVLLAARAADCAAVVATDLPANLPLLRQNVERAAAVGAGMRARRRRQGGEEREPERERDSAPPPPPPPPAAAVVVAHAWGSDVAPVLRAGGVTPGRGFDAVFLCDGMYVSDPPGAVEALALSVCRLVDRPSPGGGGEKGQGGWALVAHGRNRGAEPAFLRAVMALGMVVEEVGRGELHPRFVCNDVSVFRLRHGGGGGGGAGAGGGGG